jgi:GDP-D-mannose 3',5'-epimerase
MKKAIVMGAGGFIGSHMVTRLKSDGYWVRGIDLKYPEFSESPADDFVIGDLRQESLVNQVIDDDIDELYQFAADMGGAGYIFTGDNDANVMHNSALINLNICHIASQRKVKRLFYSSSACIYPEHNQLDPNNPNCKENSAYPAAPDSEYGWEKLFSERLYLAFQRNYGLNVRIARYHNIFGPEGSWNNGKEKAPAALCRKVATAKERESIEVWGNGQQTRSFLYINECIDATLQLMHSHCTEVLNIGSEEMVSINQLAEMIIGISNKSLSITNINGEDFIQKYGHPCPIGVNGRNSDNSLYYDKIDWKVSEPLINGIKKTYNWIQTQVEKN